MFSMFSMFNSHLRTRLSKMINDGRIPNALLFVGSDGSGTLALAIAFAMECTKATSLQHPDIKIISALPSGKADTEEDLPEDVIDELIDMLKSIEEDPYQTFGLKNASQIRISQIRSLKRMLSLSSVQAGRRVVIVYHADEMNTEAANAFLKTLEEPHEDVTIILTTQQPMRLLPTITSRCQEIFVPPIPETEIVQLLTEKHQCSVDDARLIARFADGDVIRARSLLFEDMKEERVEALNVLRSALKGRDYRVGLVEAVQKACETKDKQRIIRLVQFITLWIRDIQSVESRGTTDLVANIDQIDSIGKFTASFGSADLSTCLTSTENAVRDIMRNVSPQLVLLTTLMEIRRTLYTTRQASNA